MKQNGKLKMIVATVPVQRFIVITFVPLSSFVVAL